MQDIGKKRVALVTGGARGIGKAVVKELALNNYSVVINYFKSKKEADILNQQLSDSGIKSMAIKCDVSDFVQVEVMKKQINSYLGFVDTVINNAGVSCYKMFCDTTTTDFDYVINSNLKSVYNVSSIFSKDMVSNQFGRIINISSIWGECGASMEVIYSASKAGVIGLTKALAKELAPSNVTVNAIAPGVIKTAMFDCFSLHDKQEITESIPLMKVGQSKDVARAVLFLAENDYITGQVLGINGGLNM